MKYPSIVLPDVKQIYEGLLNNEEAINEFDKLTNLLFAASRQLWVGDLTPEIGDLVEASIRFWNQIDDNDKIPVGDRQPIVLTVSSNGGDLDAAFTIVDAIRLSCTPVYTLNIGCAYSGGAFIAMAGHKRYCYPRATYLLHEGSIEGAGGDAHKFRNLGEFYKKRVDQIKDIVVEFSRITEEVYEKQRKDDWWFTAEEALQAGMVDEIITAFPTFNGDFYVNREEYNFVN